MRRHRTIHKQMVIRIVITVTIAITIISAFSYNAIRSIIQEHVQLTLRSKAQTLVKEIEAIVRQQKSMLDTYGKLIKRAYTGNETKDYIEDLTSEFAKQPSQLVLGYWYLSQSNYDGKGNIFTWYGLNGGEEITNLKDRYRADSIFSVDRNSPKYDYYYGAIQRGGIHITNPYMGEYSDIWMLSISMPLYDDRQMLMGVAGIDLRFQDMQQHLSSLQLETAAGSMLLLSKEGQILHRKTTSNVDKMVTEVTSEQLDQIIQTGLLNMKSTDFVFNKKNNVYYYTVPIKGTDWNALLILPATELSKLLIKLLIVFAITFLVLILIVYLFVHLWVNRLISKPMAQLVNMSLRLSKGDYSQSIQFHVDNEWKQLGDHMNQMQDHLQHRVKLEQEMKRINSLKVVGEMAAAISHEIRNPLTTVRGFLQLLRNKPEHSKEFIYFDTMIEEILRANTIITEYLTLAQNKFAEFKPQSLNDIIEQLFPLVQATAAVNCQYITLHLKPLPLVALEHNEVRQLLHNIIRNGLEAMEPNQVLKVRTYSLPDRAVLEIEDEGHGFDPYILQHAGTPFLTSKNEGTGLGLAICYSIVQRHKGTISISSTSEGSLIRIEFPVTE